MGTRKCDTNGTDGDTRILYKKSNNTIFVQSLTCSGTSQFYTKHGQIKKNIPQTNQYYIDGGKVKRDLSIETEVCLLRRYYKSKLSKLSNHYSTVLIKEIDTIKRNQPDNSACGDNDCTEVNMRPDLDLTSTMFKNLKHLVNKYIRKELLDNEDTKQKIDTVLDSLLHKFELNQQSVNSSSSCSTYVLNNDGQSQIKKQRVLTSITCQYNKQKSCSTGVTASSYKVSNNSSYQSMPFPYKNLRIISTLSIPRKSHNYKNGKKKSNSLYKSKKIKHNDVLCSINTPSKLIMHSSSYDLLAVSTKSFTKRCATYDVYKKKKHNRNQRIVLVPKPNNSNITNKTITFENEKVKNENNEIHMNAAPSLVKSIFAGDPANITSTDKNMCYAPKSPDCKIYDLNMFKKIADITPEKATCKKPQEEDFKYIKNKSHVSYQSKPTTIDFYKQKLEFPNILKQKHVSPSTEYKCKHNYQKDKKVKSYNKRKKNKITAPLTYRNLKNKHFTYLYRKASSNQDIKFLKQCQSIFSRFAKYKGKKNIKLDIHVNVFPIIQNESKNDCTKNSHKSLNKYGSSPSSSKRVLKQNCTVICNDRPSTFIPTELKDKSSIKEDIQLSKSKLDLKIIPLLDGAASKAKYIFNENSVDKLTDSADIVSKDRARNTVPCNCEITQEINELKSAIKDLASTAEKFIAKHSKNSRNISKLSQNYSSDKVFTDNSFKRQSIARKPSKTIQFSSNFANPQNQSRLNISEEPKKKDSMELHSILTKKSTSYHIIDSETILKVTDMTSANDVNGCKIMDNALTCSLPKSKSLYEILPDKNNQKMVSLLCNECNGTIHKVTNHAKSLKKCFLKRQKEKSLGPLSPSANCSKLSHALDIGDVCSDKCDNNNTTSDNYSTAVYIDDDDDLNLSDFQKHRGMRFGEGFVYCILLLIPLAAIAILFYEYVFQDYLSTLYKDDASKKFYLKIADLGF